MSFTNKELPTKEQVVANLEAHIMETVEGAIEWLDDTELCADDEDRFGMYECSMSDAESIVGILDLVEADADPSEVEESLWRLDTFVREGVYYCWYAGTLEEARKDAYETWKGCW